MNVEHFEAEVLALLGKYRVEQCVFLFKDGMEIKIRAVACSPVDGVMVEVLLDAIGTAIRECRAAANAAARKKMAELEGKG